MVLSLQEQYRRINIFTSSSFMRELDEYVTVMALCLKVHPWDEVKTSYLNDMDSVRKDKDNNMSFALQCFFLL